MTKPRPPLLLSDQIDDALAEHFAALGVGTVSAYKLWCHRHGLDKALDKTDSARAEEVALYQSLQAPADPTHSKYHDPKQAEWIRRLFRGELADMKLTDLWSRLHSERLGLAADPAAQEAFARLVLHVEKYGHLLRPMPAIKRLGRGVHNTYIAGLAQLARHHAHWRRPLEDWRPDTSKERIQFGALARYLLAQYDVPPSMDTAWFQGHTQAAYEQQRWYLHVAGGQNIRTAGLPMHLTKKAAHLFMQITSPHHTLIQALRIAQVNALGGDNHLAWYIASTPLGDGFDNEAFWVSVVHFFVNNQRMLHRSYVQPIYDYIHHHKYRPQQIHRPDGSEGVGPPPMPNFGMKGRSAAKLIYQVDQWHETLAGDEDVPLKTWAPTGWTNYRMEAFDDVLQHRVVWSVYELCTSQQLQVEGRVMGHCVYSYADQCLSGATSIWSIRALNPDEEGGIEKHVLTVAVDNAKRIVTQAAGKFNMNLNQRARPDKERRAGSLYVHLLRESGRILRLWMDQVGLTRVGNS